MTTERKYPTGNNHIAQYAMYAYCFLAMLSLANSVCSSIGVSVNIPSVLLTIKQMVLMLSPIVLWGAFRLTLPTSERLLRRCSEVMVSYYALSFLLSLCFKFGLIPMMQNGMITKTATLLTWIESSIGLLSVIASLTVGCRLGNKHKGSMHQLGTALILVFIVWLIAVNFLPATTFYLLGNSHQTVIAGVNMFTTATTTLVYIYAYYRMYRAINDAK